MHVTLTRAYFVAVAQAAVGLAVALGAPVSPTARDSIVAVVAALAAALPIGGAVIGHAQIVAGPAPTPPAPPASSTHEAAS